MFFKVFEGILLLFVVLCITTQGNEGVLQKVSFFLPVYKFLKVLLQPVYVNTQGLAYKYSFHETL